MGIKYFGILVLMSFPVLWGCEDKTDQWKEPVNVSFIFDVNTEPTKQESLQFTGGYLMLAEFECEGKRIQADDIHWFSDYDYAYRVDFDSLATVDKLEYDLPQGNYTKIEISFRAEAKYGPGIVVTGTYTSSDYETYPLVLEINTPEIYSLIAKNKEGNREVVLFKDRPATARVRFDPGFWFNAVSRSDLDKAKIVNRNGQPTIVINDIHNKNIFAKVNGKADKATELIFEL